MVVKSALTHDCVVCVCESDEDMIAWEFLPTFVRLCECFVSIRGWVHVVCMCVCTGACVGE